MPRQPKAEAADTSQSEPVAQPTDEMAQAAETSEQPAAAPQDTPQADDTGPLEWSDTLVFPEQRAGQCRAEVNPDKYRAVMVGFETSDMQRYRDMGVRFPVYDQRDEDGELYVRNQDIFLVDRATGYLLDGDCVIGVWRKSDYEKVRARDVQKAQAPLRVIVRDTDRKVAQATDEVPVFGDVTVTKGGG